MALRTNCIISNLPQACILHCCFMPWVPSTNWEPPTDFQRALAKLSLVTRHVLSNVCDSGNTLSNTSHWIHLNKVPKNGFYQVISLWEDQTHRSKNWAQWERLNEHRRMRWSSSWSSVAAWGSTFGWISQRGPGGEACISDFERQALDSDIWPNRKITDVVKEQVWIWFWEKSQANGMLVASCPLPTSTALVISDS